MASYQQLQDQVTAWLNRRDVAALIPSWVQLTETDIGARLRARCMIARGTQPIDANFITLPSNFLSIESIRDTTTNRALHLDDSFTGPLAGRGSPSYAYRLVGDCIEFLPHPTIPPDPTGWVPQSVDMVWYAAPTPLQLPSDTNPVLERLFQVYLFGVCRYGAAYELDDARSTQMDTKFAEAVNDANLWKVTSDYSGAPLRAVVRGF